jgi:hypothetical protein
MINDEMLPDYQEVFESHLPNILPRELVNIIKDYTFNYDDVLSYHGLVRCLDCGNIWDGNAQCHCWEFYSFNDGFNYGFNET